MGKRTGSTAPHPSNVWVPMQPGEAVKPSPEAVAFMRRKWGDEAVERLLAEATEVWVSPLYVVHVTRREDGTPYELSIRRRDRKPHRDWRHFQRIKNDIAGPETEAVELYPAMSRLMDTANQYFLWCLPPGERMPVGYEFPHPHLLDAEDHEGVPSEQRELDEDWRELMDLAEGNLQVGKA